MNGRICGTKPLYVALAQRKEERKAHLAAQYVNRINNVRMQQLGHIFQPGGAGGYFVPTLAPPQRFYGPQVTHLRSQPRWATQQPVRQQAGAQNADVKVLHPAAGGYPNITGATNAQYRQAPAAGVRQQAQGGQGAQAAGIRNSARPITGQQQAVQVRKTNKSNEKTFFF